MDGSRSKGRTFHAGGLNRGRFKVKRVNHPQIRCVSRRVQVSEANLPCWRAESWMVRGQKGEPSTLLVDIMDGSYIKHEPPHEAP